jgi:hypothetical protein
MNFFHWFYSPLGPWPLLFSFMIILQTVGLLGRVISSSQGLYLNTGQHKDRINTYTHQTSMPCVGFETTIPASERVKSVHALDRSAIVTGNELFTFLKYSYRVCFNNHDLFTMCLPGFDTLYSCRQLLKFRNNLLLVSSSPKIEATGPPETLVATYQTRQCHNHI